VPSAAFIAISGAIGSGVIDTPLLEDGIGLGELSLVLGVLLGDAGGSTANATVARAANRMHSVLHILLI
jgi:hypothetical protein